MTAVKQGIERGYAGAHSVARVCVRAYICEPFVAERCVLSIKAIEKKTFLCS